MPDYTILLDGLGIPESPRWHEGRLWFCNWIGRQVMAVDMDGKAEVVLTRAPDSHPMGYSIDWLPDGRLLTTGDKVLRQEPDGSMAVHAGQPANEIVVDARGNAYINGADFEDFVAAGTPPKPGYIKLVTPDGHLRQVAGDIQFPNGMVIAPDGRTLIISESMAAGSPRSASTAMAGCRGGGCSPRDWARTASAWMPRARCGCRPAGPRSSASPRAARSRSAWNSRRTGRRSR